MNRASLIGHLIELYDEVRTLKQPADVFVASFFRSRHYLGSKDRRFITETLYGMFRNILLLEAYVGAVRSSSGRRDAGIPSLCLYSAYAVRIAREEPPAVLPEVSGLWRIYCGDIECEPFLQKLAVVDPFLLIPDDIERRLSITYSLPDFMIGEWLTRYGTEETGNLCKAIHQPAPLTLRVNTLRTSRDHCREALHLEGVETHPANLSPVGLRATKRFNAQALRSFRDGLFEIQDEGSQLLSLLVGARPGMRVVDACAGGGGKTLHLAAIMENQGHLVAIDVQQRRLNNIRERIHRAGVTIAEVLLAGRDQTPIERLHDSVDAVLVDAPCSGSGTLRRNPVAKLLITEDTVEQLSRTQHKVLQTYAQLVKPGGRIVYTTCSLFLKENEAVVESFLADRPDFRLVPAPDILSPQGIALPSSDGYLTLLPHRTTTDGFFAAVMERSI